MDGTDAPIMQHYWQGGKLGWFNEEVNAYLSKLQMARESSSK